MAHPADRGVGVQAPGEFGGVGAGPLVAHMQGAYAAQREPGLKRAGDRPVPGAVGEQRGIPTVGGSVGSARAGDRDPHEQVGVPGEVLRRRVDDDVADLELEERLQRADAMRRLDLGDRALAEDADDLVQDTLVRALRSERLFLGGDVRSWLYTILTNLNKNRRRSLARRPPLMPLLDNNADASGTEAEGRDIERALSTLVEEQRSVLLLVMLEGMSYREVADIQGVPIGTVMSRIARARAQVKDFLDGERPRLRQVK